MRRSVWILAALLAATSMRAAAQDTDGPGKRDLSSAERYLSEFEKKVERFKGQPFKLGYDETEALKRIKALNEQFPGHPKVKDLFERARKALLASKGKTTEIPSEYLLYRRNEQKLKTLFAAKAEEVWKDLEAKAKAELAVEKPFPAPSHREVDAETLIGKYVILDEFEYPTNEFTALQGQYVHVGSGATGFYYVILHGKGWLGAYEALRRYRRLINRDLPEDGKWTVLGRIRSLDLMIPQAGKEKSENAHWGWGVEPVAIRVPGCTVTVADPEHESGGRFAGEDEAEKIKSGMYSVTSVPADVTPQRLLEIYVTAIKEKNYPLFLDCIDPEWKKSKAARSRIAYHWDLHQERFADLYVHVTFGEPSITVLKGFDSGAEDLESAFLTEKEKAEIARRSEPLLENALVWTKAWDERGRQYGGPKPHNLRRYERKRWYISDYSEAF